MIKIFFFVSVASYWEIIIKKSLGKIHIHNDIISSINDSGFLWLDIKIHHINYLEKLPLLHHDPFDRLLIAQSCSEDLKILTSDEEILRYNILSADI